METPPLNSLFPSAPSLVEQTLRLFRKHWQIFIGIPALPTLFLVLTILLREEALLAGVSSLIAIVAGFFSRLALIEATVQEGRPVDGVWGAYKRGWRLLAPFALITILWSLALLGGFILLVVPAILLSVWLSLWQYVLFAENRRGLAALVGSWHYIKGYWWTSLWRYLFWGILVLTAALVFLLLIGGYTLFTGGTLSTLQIVLITVFNSLLLSPLKIIYPFLLYKSLREAKTGIPVETEGPQLKKKITTFIALGVLVSLALLIVSGFLLAKSLASLTK